MTVSVDIVDRPSLASRSALTPKDIEVLIRQQFSEIDGDKIHIERGAQMPPWEH